MNEAIAMACGGALFNPEDAAGRVATRGEAIGVMPRVMMTPELRALQLLDALEHRRQLRAALRRALADVAAERRRANEAEESSRRAGGGVGHQLRRPRCCR